MCSMFCTCPGDIISKHYKQYKNIPAETYQKYNRTFYPEQDFERLKQSDPVAYREAILEDKSMHWAPEVAENAAILAESMLQCYENAVKIQAERAKLDPETAEEQ